MIQYESTSFDPKGKRVVNDSGTSLRIWQQQKPPQNHKELWLGNMYMRFLQVMSSLGGPLEITKLRELKRVCKVDVVSKGLITYNVHLNNHQVINLKLDHEREVNVSNDPFVHGGIFLSPAPMIQYESTSVDPKGKRVVIDSGTSLRIGQQQEPPQNQTEIWLGNMYMRFLHVISTLGGPLEITKLREPKRVCEADVVSNGLIRYNVHLNNHQVINLELDHEREVNVSNGSFVHGGTSLSPTPIQCESTSVDPKGKRVVNDSRTLLRIGRQQEPPQNQTEMWLGIMYIRFLHVMSSLGGLLEITKLMELKRVCEADLASKGLITYNASLSNHQVINLESDHERKVNLSNGSFVHGGTSLSPTPMIQCESTCIDPKMKPVVNDSGTSLRIGQQQEPPQNRRGMWSGNVYRRFLYVEQSWWATRNTRLALVIKFVLFHHFLMLT